MGRGFTESLALEGGALTVTLAPTLAVIDRVILVTGADKVSLSREEVEHLLRSENLAGLDGKQRWRHAVARVAAGLPKPGGERP